MPNHTIIQPMGISHIDFFRLLPHALNTRNFVRDGVSVACELDEKRVDISLGPEGERRIALLTIPTTEVTIQLTGFNDQERDVFMVTFDRAYQRGGG